jgi:hypothetical protein
MHAAANFHMALMVRHKLPAEKLREGGLLDVVG